MLLSAMAAALALVLLFAGALPAFAQLKAGSPRGAGPAQEAPAAPARSSATPGPAPAQPAAGVIAIQDIPLEADRLTTVLRVFDERVAPTASVRGVEAGLPGMAQRIADAQLETKGQIAATSSMVVLTNLGDLWRGIDGDLQVRADQLKAHATDVGAVLDQLAVLVDRWTRTREEARRVRAPQTVFSRTDEALRALAAARARASDRRASLLALQVRVGEQLAMVEEASAQIAAAISADLSTLLDPHRPTVWRAWRESPEATDLATRVRESAAPQLDVLARFVVGRSRRTAVHAVLLVALAAGGLAVRRRVQRWEADGSGDPVFRPLALPFSTALIVLPLLTDWFYARPPMIVVHVLGVVLLVPVVRVLSRITAPAPTAALGVGLILFVLNRLRDIALLNAPVADQYAMLLLLGGAAVSLVWLRWRRALVVGPFRMPEPVAWIGIALLGASFAAGALGYLRLAIFVGAGLLRSVFTGLGLYASTVVALAIFAFLLRVWPLERLRMVKGHRLLIERRARVLLAWGVALFWLRETLLWFSVADEAQSLGLALLDYRLTRGFVSLSLGDVLAFVATVWLAFLVSRFVRFALEEDVYPRLPLGRGVPYALSNLLHYLILLLGFLAAVGAMGVDLNKVTLLTGAFGVGVGFGLQTIVNNFVSGIILLLERPIQVGDAIQMTDLDGEVRRIGIRSTTVHTWRGAEVIVPNATLISGNVTNWTLSDRTRRFEVPVGVAYGTDPERVIELLGQAAASVPGVLVKPAPVVLFQGFGDSALNFEVRAWTARFEEWAAVHSQVAVAVNAALKAAGIEMPFPQRDVTVRFPPLKAT